MTAIGSGDLASAERQAFGYEALGPILAEFCLRLWLFQRFFADADDTTLLFCARGGLRLQRLYERFLARTGLPAAMAHDNLMISRLIAARTAIERPGDGLLSELGREFAGRPMREVAVALTQRGDIALSLEWDAAFEGERFRSLLAATDDGAMALRQAVASQDASFRDHLASRTQGRGRVILCDTGLYGSTVRLLREGMPERKWYCLQFARANYKNLATPHFAHTRGLSIESDVYLPWHAPTAGLRFWHLIEAALEPDLPSARVFEGSKAGGDLRSNLEVEGWQARIAPDGPGLFAGALAYIDALDEMALPHVAGRAALGWRRFKRAVVWPDRAAVAALSLNDRSRDFGRSDHVAQFAQAGAIGPLARIRDSLWREGAVRRAFPRLGWAGLLVIEAAHTARALRFRGAALRRRFRRETSIDRAPGMALGGGP
ncbi:hypothetical protein SAMN05216304_110101 [Bosea sp. OK403]|uniref:glycosyltransferase n=1 Tax=Bosea sp. OK403 TaxID=1855286 RepID=UPI0008DEB9C0|nr:glycosyltransferase [Bosea sp. OK403]SFJ61521.1 hypothetical protein SAMN05216304_110101 [Bosea sp. OK403]